MEIITGKIQKAQRVVIYGSEGIGKSTLAAQFPKPLFIDTEGSTDHMDVSRTEKPSSWQSLNAQIDYLINNDIDFQTLVIDTIDWVEKLCIESLLADHNKKSIGDFGFGNGYVYLCNEMNRFLEKLESLRSQGIHLVLNAHAIVRRHELPEETGAYDRYELKLEKKVSSLIKEWCDMLLFCNYETLVVEINDKKKAQGGRRVIHTSHKPTWDAKNRHNLQEKIPMEYAEIAHCFSNQKIDETAFNSQLYELMSSSSITAEEIESLVSSKGYYPEGTKIDNYDSEFIQNRIIKVWDKFLTAIVNRRQK